MTGRLAMIGAINVDLVVRGAPLPRPGETVVGGTFTQHHGGKGGNQAVAAARVLPPDSVVMIGAVGEDALGSDALAALESEGVITRVARTSMPTGVALIVVDGQGQNLISVAPGANGMLDAGHVLASLEELEPAVVMCSLEVPLAAVEAAVTWARETGATSLLNPAPANPDAERLFPFVDLLTPNQFELEALGPIPAGPRVIQTRGAQGATIDGETRIEAPVVTAVDTTGAGDCFNGVLAAGLLEGLWIAEALRRAVAAATLSVTRVGAREGMPTRAELEAFLAR